MIVNTSVLTKEDIAFINARLRQQPKQIALRVIAVLLGLFFVLAGVLELLTLVKWKKGGVSDAMLCAAFFVFAYLLLSRGIFLSHYALKRSLKYQSLFAPRDYTVDDGGITAHHSYGGAEYTNRFSFENADCYYAGERAVYLRFHGEKKMLVFMCMQDSGYTEGSRAELIALLESRGIARGR